MSFVPKFGAVLLAGYLVWLGWVEFGPRKPEIGAGRAAMADHAINKMVEDLRLNRGSVNNIVLLHFVNDPTDYFTSRLRLIIEQRGVFDLEDRSLVEKIRNKLKLRHPVYDTVAVALKIGKSADVQGVLYGALLKFESFPGGAVINVKYQLLNVKTGEITYTGSYVEDTSKSILPAVVPDKVKEQTQGIPWYLRILGWVLIALLLPVFTISFIRTMVAKRSNRRNLFVLAVYTGIDAIVAYLMIGASFASAWPIILFALAVILGTFYNLTIMAFALKLED